MDFPPNCAGHDNFVVSLSLVYFCNSGFESRSTLVATSVTRWKARNGVLGRMYTLSCRVDRCGGDRAVGDNLPSLALSDAGCIVVVEPTTRPAHVELLTQAFALRHRTFVEDRGWHELRRPDGLDRDQHDTGAAIHILDIKGSLVCGHLRVIPGGYFHAAKADPARFINSEEEPIFGLSRLCYRPELRGPMRWNGIERLHKVAIDLARRAGIQHLIFDTDPILVLYLRALGFKPQVIGDTVSHHGRPMQPILLTVGPDRPLSGMRVNLVSSPA